MVSRADEHNILFNALKELGDRKPELRKDVIPWLEHKLGWHTHHPQCPICAEEAQDSQ